MQCVPREPRFRITEPEAEEGWAEDVVVPTHFPGTVLSMIYPLHHPYYLL